MTNTHLNHKDMRKIENMMDEIDCYLSSLDYIIKLYSDFRTLSLQAPHIIKEVECFF